ncbi:SPW repeat protein [Methylobacterium haplocladii]|uniref:SPW repeat-containing integral membrane domain-containing protein n=1 Tax=Methylobacterium haplocladii TaxID=1176176 RepID=A0A512IPE4_9HYPH|nr:SPW repeat protein [Methylobacterium haplocladii]GEO99565.1 hypothetical protein MHA02_19530 [Methylobacterium haplocladii]GJD85856.1 hypothetical protein HPGCJGGD_3750 [Methylobacterium haplocladii]GLS58541.1 hypothetical protein GCM10007887_12050 [Methylobacterium haplocladii]
MRTLDHDLEDIFLAGWSLMLGVALVIAPWWLGFDNNGTATWNAWACGSAVVVLSMLALGQVYDWLEYLVAVIGLWLACAPWVLGFGEVQAAAWTHAGFGLALIISAGAELWRLHEAPGARSV